jgi:RimJ/RimL family protein N-acetyltransferase
MELTAKQHGNQVRAEWLEEPESFLLCKHMGDLVGWGRLHKRSKAVHVGVFVHPDYQRSNAGLLLSLAGLRVAFNDWKAPKVFARTRNHNKPTMMLLGALGFKRIKRYTSHTLYQLRWADWQRREI